VGSHEQLLLKLSLFPLPCSCTSELDLQNLSIFQAEPSHDEACPNQITALVPDRFFRQARSTSGKLAYVVFGSGESSGVYNNWCVKFQSLRQLLTRLYRQAANYYLSTFRPNQKPDNRGYDSYLEANEAWNFFRKTGIVPLAPIDGGVTANLAMDQHHVLPSPSLPQSSPVRRALSSPVHMPRVGLPTHLGFQAAIPATFYVVHVGYSPGVYNTL
jgi:hypothetical protein